VALAAVLLAPLALAQGRVYRVGFLSARATRATVDEAFFQRMRELGYVEGSNLAVEYRFAANDLARLPALANELVRGDPDLIVTATTAGTRAAMNATQRIPIVMAASSDPVGAGLVQSLARPGGNVTGMSLQTTDVARKRLQLLLEIVPGVTRVGLLAERVRDASVGTTQVLVDESRAVARQLGIHLIVREVERADDLSAAFADFVRERAQALIVQVTPLFIEHGKRIVQLASRDRIPAMYEARNFVDDGGLVSYGPDLRGVYRQAAEYAARILKGARPSDLPVEQPRIALVVNRGTARALDLAIPVAVLSRADEILD
jgi:ABC-type uncharacterized transport system substrate-binding protein